MSGQGVLQQELERSFGDGPEHRPVEDQLRAGRRVVRRRRVAAGVAGAAVVAVFGTTYAVVGLEPVQRSGEVSGDPSPTQEAFPQWMFIRGQFATLHQGELVLRDGATVLERVENPLDRRAPNTSLGLAVDYRGQQKWLLLTWFDSGNGAAGSSASTQSPERTSFTFEEWLANEVATQQRGPAGNLVEFTQGERLGPLPGTEILDQRPDIDLGPTFAAPGDPTAVARVRFRAEIWFVVARHLDGSRAEFIATRATDAGDATTIDEFLAYARGKYESGEGLR